MTEIVLYGGKGGVGKTTMAAASGIDLARDGHETLVVSTDPAHSLADAVETGVGGEPTNIRANLWAVEVDPQAGIDRYRSLFEQLASDLADAGIRLDEQEVASLFTSGVLPGSDELAAPKPITRTAQRRTALNKLYDLEGETSLTNKKVGGRSRVWWIPVEV